MVSENGKAVVPRHVAIVMDGNGRWAKKRFLPRFFGHHFEKTGMIVEHADLVDFRRAFANLGLRLRDIFTVLAAAGIRTERRSDEGQRPLHAGGLHFGERVGQERMPVAVAPIDWQVQHLAQRFQ